MSFFRAATPLWIQGPFGHLPGQVVDNDALVRWMDVEIRGSWIERKSGVRQRHWAAKEEACSDLAVAAAEKLFAAHAGLRERVRQIVLSTVSGDYPTPPTSPLVQDRLGLSQAGAFDLAAACAGFPSALHVAACLAHATRQTQLVVSSEIRSKFLHPKDFATSALFGDGAAAAAVEVASEGAQAERGDFRFLASQLFSEGSIADLIAIPAGGTRLPRSSRDEDHCLRMKDGAAVFVKAVRGMCDAAEQFLENAGVEKSAVDWLVPHQANLHLIREVSKRMGTPPERVVEIVQTTGNTSGASTGLALAHLRSSGALKAGQKILIAAAGGGGLAACVLLEVAESTA